MKSESPLVIVRLDLGSKLPEALVKLAADRNWMSGHIWGIGAVSDTVLAYYDLETKSYVEHRIDGAVEVVSMSGNLSRNDAIPFWHIHMIVAGREGHCHGGHLVSCTVALTLECSIYPSDVVVHRQVDDSLGLKLLKL